jgi:HAD superfamily hydrolase (TIGR01509 family)
VVAAVIFDLDGVLIETEELWDRARRDIAREHGGSWTAGATLAMQGMSSPEWSRYMREEVGVPLRPGEINRLVVDRLLALYRDRLPLLPGATEAVERLAARWTLGLASSSNRELIDEVLSLANLASFFSVAISSEEVARGKPAPDVYLEAARRLGVAPRDCVAVEDSTNGIRSAAAAEMTVVAVPNREFPPAAGALELTAVSIGSLDEPSVELVQTLAPDPRA